MYHRRSPFYPESLGLRLDKVREAISSVKRTYYQVLISTHLAMAHRKASPKNLWCAYPCATSELPLGFGPRRSLAGSLGLLVLRQTVGTG